MSHTHLLFRLLAAWLCVSACTCVVAQDDVAKWRYTFDMPPDGWTEPGFDDSTWKSGPGGFGKADTPGARIGTEWTTPDIWLRRTIKLDAVPEKPALLVHHDEDAEVSINGQAVAKLAGYSRQYEVHPLTNSSKNSLRVGRNVVAVHCHQTRGGQYIDVRVIDTANPPNLARAQVSSKPDRAAEPDAFDLMTRWGEQVTPENAWREYPRPQLKRDNWLSLNGLWDFAIVGDEGRWTTGRVENATFDPLVGELPPQPGDWAHKILVPFSPETQLSGVVKSVRPNQVMWYRRSFKVPDDWSGQRVSLHFEAVDWHAVVLVNGAKVGDNRGGYVPFTCDLTDALKGEGEQELVVVAWDPTNMGDQTVGKQALPELRRGFRYNPNSGIWQSVWLEPVPLAAHIRGLKITPVAGQRAIDVGIELEGTTKDLSLRVIAERDGTAVAGKPGEALRVNLGDSYGQWSPESPVLHELSVELLRGNAVVDRTGSYFALRSVDIAADEQGLNRVRLNGRPIFQFGPLDQGYWPDGALTPPSEEAVRYDLEYLKKIGCNMVRVHIKVHPRRWYYEADRLGLLVWQDFVCTRKFDANITAASADQWELEQRRMMDHLHNHPSVVFWIVFNEGWGQYDTERLTAWAKAYDPSRLVTCASGWTDFPVGDIYDNHDYSFNISPAHGANFSDRASLCGECGGFNVLIPGHLWHSEQTQQARVNPAGETGRESYSSVDQWKSRYRDWLTNLRLMRPGGLNAAVYTQITDVEHECNGWLTYDRRISKIPIDQLARWHAKLYEPIRTNVLLDLAGSTVLQRRGAVPEGWAGPRFDAGDWAELEVVRSHDLEPAAVAEGRVPLHVRARMTLSSVPKRLAMHTVGAGQWELFLNGEPVMAISNSDRAGRLPYSTIVLPESAAKHLREGDNCIALRLRGDKTTSAALVDFSLLAVEE